MRATDLAAAAGITYRQLDVWVRRRLIHPAPRMPDERQGHPRHFTDREAAVVIDAGALVAAGLRPDAALRTARLIARYGHAQLGCWRITKTTPDTDPEQDTGDPA